MDEKKKIEQETRAMFDKLHIEQAKDPKIFQRLTALLDTEYLKVPKNFFEGKVCLDAGCGSNVNATYSMLAMGAKKVHALDLDESIFNTGPKILEEFGPSGDRWELKVGNVHEVPYSRNYFDFVHCVGVLHHSTDIYKGLAELCRVVKPGGMLHVSVNGTGGIMRDFTNVLRERYAKDQTFKNLIDTTTGVDLMVFWDWISTTMRDHGDEPGIAREDAEQLFNDDLLLTIRDRVQAPLYLETTEEEMRKFLTDHGFEGVVRLKKYPIQHNIRRYLAPLYYEDEHPIAKLLYGDGIPRFRAMKKI